MVQAIEGVGMSAVITIRRFGALVVGLLAILALGAAGASRAAAVSYPYASTTGTGYGTEATPTALTVSQGNTDDGIADLALPFSFNIFGSAYGSGSTLRVSTNGFIAFANIVDSPVSRPSNTSLPASTLTMPAVMPFWDDFVVTETYDVFPTGDLHGMWWGVSGTAPYRRLAVRWTGYRFGSLPRERLTFQVILYETSNEIRFVYLRHLTDPVASPASATIGIQEGAGGDARQYTYNATPAGWGSSLGILYGPQRPTPTSSTVHPVISGTAQVGQTLSVSTGSWNGAPHTYQYQWERCTDSACGTWTNIPGATSATYTPQAVDVGHRVFAAVKAVNGWGASLDWDFAYPTDAVVSDVAAPTNTVKPHVSGTAAVGSTVTVSNGTWTPAPDQYEYEWWRCVVGSGGSCTPAKITGATSASYTLAAGEANATVYARVRAHTAGGWSSWSTSDNSLGPVPPDGQVPVNTAAPAVSGLASIGATLSTTRGSWSYWPDSYDYAWYRCPGGTCTTPQLIGGQTAAQYTTTGDDTGALVYSVVRAHNVEGWSAGVASSTRIGPIAGTPVLVPPQNVFPPQTSDGGDENVDENVDGTGRGTGTTSGAAMSWNTKGAVTTTRRGRSFRVRAGMTLTCPALGERCIVDVLARTRVTQKGRRRTVTIAKARLTARARSALPVVFTLNSAGAKLLRAKRKLTVVVTASADNGGAKPAKASRSITVRRPR